MAILRFSKHSSSMPLLVGVNAYWLKVVSNCSPLMTSRWAKIWKRSSQCLNKSLMNIRYTTKAWLIWWLGVELSPRKKERFGLRIGTTFLSIVRWMARKRQDQGSSLHWLALQNQKNCKVARQNLLTSWKPWCVMLVPLSKQVWRTKPLNVSYVMPYAWSWHVKFRLAQLAKTLLLSRRMV